MLDVIIDNIYLKNISKCKDCSLIKWQYPSHTTLVASAISAYIYILLDHKNEIIKWSYKESDCNKNIMIKVIL